ncbi:MAG: hypothetical protein AAFX53_00730 [Bacteroidota bacterium]
MHTTKLKPVKPDTPQICRHESLNITIPMFESKDYGRPISEQLSRTLRRNTTKDDFANISSATGISFSTIRDVVYRTNSLTRSNAKAIHALVKVAFDNSLARQLIAEGDKHYLNSLL